MLLQIVRESGFVLFLIFLANYMVKFGGAINDLIAFWREPSQGIFWDVMESLKPTFDFEDKIKLIIVIAVILYNGWHLSQTKRVTVDKICVQYFINQTLIYPLPIADIDTLLLLNESDPELVIIASNKAISLGHFAQPLEGLDYLRYLAQSIANFRSDFEPTAAFLERSNNHRNS
jgi:hypothetical protein